VSPATGVLHSHFLAALAREAGAAGGTAFLVGGAVRDAMLGREPVDHDVAFEGSVAGAATLVSALADLGWVCEARHGRFGTARLRAQEGERLDLAVTREETYPHPGALPVVSAGVPIGRDLARRDFTIHAMALRLGSGGIEEGLLDPFGGEADLGQRRIRLLHAASLADDPTRVFRAARYAARLGFELDSGFAAAMQRAVSSGAFARISGDRLRRAIQEVLGEENRAVSVDLLKRLGVLPAVVDGWEVGPGVLAELRTVSGPEEAWAVLVGAAPAGARELVARRLSFSRALRRRTGCPR
jgi:tRNA nucleotidyltransferase/poly(A) polymerase